MLILVKNYYENKTHIPISYIIYNILIYCGNESKKTDDKLEKIIESGMLNTKQYTQTLSNLMMQL